MASVIDDREYYDALAVARLRLAQDGEITRSDEVRFRLPRDLAERMVAFREYFYGDLSDVGTAYNCHTFVATVKGWLPVGATDLNICGWTSADLREADQYELITTDDIEPGMAAGLTVAAAPRHLVHSFIGIDGGRNIAVRGNGDRMIIVDNATTVQHYERKHGSNVLLHAMKTRPSVMGTDNWERVAEKMYPDERRRAQVIKERERAILLVNRFRAASGAADRKPPAQIGTGDEPAVRSARVASLAFPRISHETPRNDHLGEPIDRRPATYDRAPSISEPGPDR